MPRHCLCCAAATAAMPAFAAPASVSSPLRAAKSSAVPACAPRARAFRSYGAAVRRARMSAPPPSRPDEDAPDDASNPPTPPLNLEVLRRRISDLDARQKAGHNPTDSVNGPVKESPGFSYEYRKMNRAFETSDDDDDDTEVLQLINDFESLVRVWVIVFTNRRDSTEGIYSLNVGDENIVLAFQDKEEANRYALCLEQQKFPMPNVAELETNELAEFCSESGFRLGFVPTGSLITPPEQSAVDDLDKWRSDSPSSSTENESGMTAEEIDTMRKKLDSLFGL